MLKTISGTYDLIPDSSWMDIQTEEIRLVCDTTSAPVFINLPEIASISGGTLNVKIYISDGADNASSNNITINAGGTNKIGSSSNYVVAVNGGGGFIQIANTTSWLLTLNNVSGGGGGISSLWGAQNEVNGFYLSNLLSFPFDIIYQYDTQILDNNSILTTIDMLNLVKGYGNLGIDGALINTINAPLLTDIKNLYITSQVVVTLNAPILKNGRILFSVANTTLTMPPSFTNGGVASSPNNFLVSLDLLNLVDKDVYGFSQSIDFADCQNLANINCASSIHFDNVLFQGCALTTTAIETILVALDNGGASNGFLYLDGGTNASEATWTANAITAKNNLVGKGWTVTTNP
jgi:hypothetical protein